MSEPFYTHTEYKVVFEDFSANPLGTVVEEYMAESFSDAHEYAKATVVMYPRGTEARIMRIAHYVETARIVRVLQVEDS